MKFPWAIFTPAVGIRPDQATSAVAIASTRIARRQGAQTSGVLLPIGVRVGWQRLSLLVPLQYYENHISELISVIAEIEKNRTGIGSSSENIALGAPPRREHILAPLLGTSDFSSGIESLLEGKRLRSDMEQNYRAIALEEYALEVQAERYFSLYQDLLYGERKSVTTR